MTLAGPQRLPDCVEYETVVLPSQHGLRSPSCDSRLHQDLTQHFADVLLYTCVLKLLAG